MQKLNNKNIIIYCILSLLLILIISVIVIVLNKKIPVIRDFSDINLDNVDKVMIVAHPDDEMLWGGASLINDDYLVVCVTCGVDEERVKEFSKVMNATNDKYIMLGYPDKTNGERDNWDSSRDNIKEDLEKIFALKDWKLIVTHNPFGEYGHIHHKMTSELVTDKVINKDNLYYFGTYYSKKNIGKVIKDMPSIDQETLNKKIKILKIYKTQIFIMTAFDQMIEHENWVSYNDWQDGAR